MSKSIWRKVEDRARVLDPQDEDILRDKQLVWELASIWEVACLACILSHDARNSLYREGNLPTDNVKNFFSKKNERNQTKSAL